MKDAANAMLKAHLAKRDTYDLVVVNGVKYEIRPESSGLQVWVSHGSYSYKVSQFGEQTHDDCLRDIIADANWKNRD